MADRSDILPVEHLAQQIDSAFRRIKTQLADPKAATAEVCQFIESLSEELHDSIEELRAASEEAQRQNEALSETRLVIEAQRHRYHDLFDAAPIGYVLTNTDGAILEANRAAAHMLGIPVDELVGKSLIAFVPPEHRSAFRQRLIEVAGAARALRWDTPYQPRNALIRHLDLTVLPTPADGPDDSGTQLRWMLQDVTDRIAADMHKLEHFFRETFEQAPVGIGHIGFNGRWLRVNQALCDLLGYERGTLQSLSVRDVANAEDAARFEATHRQILEGASPVGSLEMCLKTTDGGMVWTHVTLSSVSDTHGHHAYGIIVVDDITESKRAVAAERKQRLLAEALRDSAMTLTSTLDFEEVLDQIMLIMSGIFMQKAAAIMLAEEADQFCVARAWGFTEETIPRLEAALKSIRTSDMPGGMYKAILEWQKPVIVGDWHHHDEWESVPDIQAIRSVICVPIIAYDKVIGCLQLHSATPWAFSDSEGDLLVTFAAHAAVAIQNARAHQQAQALAAHEERQRLARELHDAVTQSLFSASIISESLLRRNAGNNDQISPHLKELHLLTRGALAEMRALLMELRPEFLLQSPLQMQIRQLADAIKSRKKLDIAMRVSGGGTLPGNVQIAFYRITQEIMNNIVKHSQADSVAIDLVIEQNRVSMGIHDNGVSFDPRTTSPGMGMTTMRERAVEIGASVEIATHPEHGTHVTVLWPNTEKGLYYVSGKHADDTRVTRR